MPAKVRAEFNRLGLAKDEFVDNDNWPTQLYVREARRMIGAYVMTEHNCRGKKVADDSVGMGAYGMDSHNCQRYVTPDGHVQNEGDVQVHGFKPYPISYRAIMPKADECENLLVPVCLSSSHIAYGSIRMEPVFMILGQSAATAAAMAIDGGVPRAESGLRETRSTAASGSASIESAALKCRAIRNAQKEPGRTIVRPGCRCESSNVAVATTSSLLARRSACRPVDFPGRASAVAFR